MCVILEVRPKSRGAGSLACVRTARDVVDYALQRRARLADLACGRISAWDACDANPHLQLAAEHYGEPALIGCPVCGRRDLRYVHYVYGDQLGQRSGQAKSVMELHRMGMDIGAFNVYVVEVCRDCGWNHLVRSFVLGRDGLAQAVDG